MWCERIKRWWGVFGLLLMLAFFSRFQGFGAAIMIFCASLIHECGHLLILWWGGGSIRRFRTSAEGMEICADSLRMSYPGEILAVLAGPVINLIAGWILIQISAFYPTLRLAAGANFVLGLFNLLPAPPLDGWRILQLFAEWELGPGRGVCIAVFGIFVSFLLAVGLMMLMMVSAGNLWLLPTATAILTAGISTAYREL
jgi:Zn-dependent protease